VQQGKVSCIGCYNWQAWKIAKALDISEFRDLARFDTLQAWEQRGEAQKASRSEDFTRPRFRWSAGDEINECA
jgi:aryl-alcohol dehydrogenase-like predicted oxidoreductase